MLVSGRFNRVLNVRHDFTDTPCIFNYSCLPTILGNGFLYLRWQNRKKYPSNMGQISLLFLPIYLKIYDKVSDHFSIVVTIVSGCLDRTMSPTVFQELILSGSSVI